jgi:hypothetical protein
LVWGHPPPHFSTHINAIIRLTSSIERASMPHRYYNLIYCVTIRPDPSLITEIEMFTSKLDI